MSDAARLLFSPLGRMGRAAFFILQLVMMPIYAVYQMLRPVMTWTEYTDAQMTGFIACGLLFHWMMLAGFMRRLRDVSLSPWWAPPLILLAFHFPLLSLALIGAAMAWPGASAPNRFGPRPLPLFARGRLRRLEKKFLEGKIAEEDYSAARKKLGGGVVTFPMVSRPS